MTLLVQMFHGSCAENDKKSHPEGGALERDGFIGFSLIGLVV